MNAPTAPQFFAEVPPRSRLDLLRNARDAARERAAVASDPATAAAEAACAREYDAQARSLHRAIAAVDYMITGQGWR
jgi:hypothetical protein